MSPLFLIPAAIAGGAFGFFEGLTFAREAVAEGREAVEGMRRTVEYVRGCNTAAYEKLRILRQQISINATERERLMRLFTEERRLRHVAESQLAERRLKLVSAGKRSGEVRRAKSVMRIVGESAS